MSAAEKTTHFPGGTGSGEGPSTSTSFAQGSPPSPHRRSRLLTWAAFILLFLVVLVIAGALLIYGVVRPHGMIYSVEEAYVHEYNFTCPHIPKRACLNAVYNITMKVENRNKKVRIQYSDVKMYVECHRQQLAMSNDVCLPEQCPGNVAYLPQKLISSHVLLKKCKRCKHPRNQKLDSTRCDLPPAPKGNVTIDVRLTAKIKFQPENWRLDGRTIKVSCSRVSAYFADGTNTFQPKNCDVEL